MKLLAYISRFLLGVVFIYSGFVKAVDPWGTQFKFEDYFIAFGMEWLIPAALFLSVLMSAAEFLIGFAFLLGIKPKLSTWSALIFMIVFTPITLWLALTNAVGDCGCFGDALILTNWETFIKNIAILVLLTPVFLYRKKFRHYISCKLEWIPVIIAMAGIVFVSIQGLRHLPYIDFLPFRPGLSMKPDSTQKDQYFVTYKDMQSGETKEYPADDFPWDDSLWMASNEFVSQRVVPGKRPEHLIVTFDANGQETTTGMILNENFQLLVVAWDLEEMNSGSVSKIQSLAAECESAQIGMALITATSSSKAETIRHDLQLPVDLHYADDILLKMVVRNNPGFVLMKDGTILAKWAWRDVPSVAEMDMPGLEKQYLNKQK